MKRRLTEQEKQQLAKDQIEQAKRQIADGEFEEVDPMTADERPRGAPA